MRALHKSNVNLCYYLRMMLPKGVGTDMLKTWNQLLVTIKFLKKIRIVLTGILLFILSNSNAAKPFPPNLLDANSSSAIPTMSANIGSTIKTPEYVIIRANDETTLSSETTGKVINLPLKEGSNFKSGDILLALDCRLQQADLNKSMAQQKATNKALESAKKLKAYGSISEFEMVKTKAEADAVNADVDKLKAIVEKCTVIAPFNGSVAEVKIHLYETVKPGDLLMKVINTENLSFEIQVPSQWLSWLHVGSRFNVHINDINKTISAKISYINPEIEPISQTVKITGQVAPPEPSLRPGMTGQAVFPDNPESQKE